MSSAKRHKRRKKKNLRQLTPLFKRTKQALILDLSDSNLDRLVANKGRGEEVIINDGCPPYMFKKIAQLRDFDKRVIWEEDRSFSDLSEEALEGFALSQERFLLPEPMSRRAELVIQESRKICTGILQYFDFEEWFDSCAFGKRAAVGLPRSEAYLDTRFSRISGTSEQVAAFRHMCARDMHLFRAVRETTRSYPIVKNIKATTVPKSWKSARVIAPDTILGGLLSRGLGSIIRQRLERNTHIDLALQQDRHRRWAKVASETGHLATIDMSKASDSFTWRHIEQLVPIDWHGALKCVCIPRCEVGDKVINLTSYMLMGSGHTFPLQTLLFYCLAEATRTLLNSRGKVSVYGDDIIIPTRIAKPFIKVMSELGFTINSEKSFYDSPDPDWPSYTHFRESCGGDFKGGVDVRPYMPECDLQECGEVPVNEYVSWCHRMINGLLDRWSYEEIPQTIGILLMEITMCRKKVSFVPEYETDHSGIRHYLPPRCTAAYDCQFVTYDKNMPQYYKLLFVRKKRARQLRERPYVWYGYWLKRNSQSPSVVPTDRKWLINVQLKQIAKEDYDIPISLSGEPNRRHRGVYRWKKMGPNE